MQTQLDDWSIPKEGSINVPDQTALPVGFQTSTTDITGKKICLGDIVDYDFPDDNPCPFQVVFEDNAFRKKYENWDNTLPKPLLEFGGEAETLRLKVVKSFDSA